MNARILPREGKLNYSSSQDPRRWIPRRSPKTASQSAYRVAEYVCVVGHSSPSTGPLGWCRRITGNLTQYMSMEALAHSHDTRELGVGGGWGSTYTIAGVLSTRMQQLMPVLLEITSTFKWAPCSHQRIKICLLLLDSEGGRSHETAAGRTGCGPGTWPVRSEKLRCAQLPAAVRVPPPHGHFGRGQEADLMTLAQGVGTGRLQAANERWSSLFPLTSQSVNPG